MCQGSDHTCLRRTLKHPYLSIYNRKYVTTFFTHKYCARFDQIQGLDNDHGQTDSRARAQRLSRAHQKVTWSMLIEVTNFYHQTKQRLHCTCVNRNVSFFFYVPKIATVRLAVEVLHNKALTLGHVGS